MEIVKPVADAGGGGVNALRAVAVVPERRDRQEASTRALMERARRAQRQWGGLTVAKRLQFLRKFRGLLVEHVSVLADPVRRVRGVSAAEILVSEIIPLADACKFLEEEAEEILSPRAPQGKRPLWLAGTRLRIEREPLGVVLILGPANYPLFIAGVQVLQAVAAGNAVIVKPGRGAGEVMEALRGLLMRAGVPEDLMAVLGDEDETGARWAIAGGVDKILVTGSSRTGAAIMAAAAQSLTPSVMELSGCDAAFVLQGADAALAAKALAFGLTMNRSRTCMRPHRVFVQESVRGDLVKHLACELGQLGREREDWPSHMEGKRMLVAALDAGARVVMGSAEDPFGFPIVLEGVDGASELAQTDAFLPMLILYSFRDAEQALGIYDLCPSALGASVFGPEAEAEKLAAKINAGFVVINDVIAPTADPRLPFSGRKRSGFGVTRGAEGLLELTRVKALATRRSNYKHLEARQPGDSEFFRAYLQMAHGDGWRQRLGGAVKLVKAGMRRSQARSAGA
jgi:acyl-CoA reductase-like NAD-dependent aldehyde dehydrogenase